MSARSKREVAPLPTPLGYAAAARRPSLSSSEAVPTPIAPSWSTSELHPPGGFVKFMENGLAQAPINIDGVEDVRTAKRLPWTTEEDVRLVSAGLNNSNDPINLKIEIKNQEMGCVVLYILE